MIGSSSSQQGIEQSPSAQTSPTLKQTFIDKLREDYQISLSSLDNEVKSLVQNGQEAKALMLFSDSVKKIIEIRETLTIFYSLFFNNVAVLQRFGSERLKQVGSELQPICELLKGTESSPKEIEGHVLRKLGSMGIFKIHWCINSIVLVEIEYMLDTLQILIEPDFLPLSANASNEPDRYIPPDVKLTVWRRDQGKCVECGSKEKLEYDHIIPISKGGSNTDRNIQLLCEKCNREKAAKIA